MTDEIWKRDEAESPCVKVCVVHPETRLCVGCHRTIDESAAWSRMTSQERRAVIDQLPGRNPRTARRGGRSARRSTAGD